MRHGVHLRCTNTPYCQDNKQQSLSTVNNTKLHVTSTLDNKLLISTNSGMVRSGRTWHRLIHSTHSDTMTMLASDRICHCSLEQRYCIVWWRNHNLVSVQGRSGCVIVRVIGMKLFKGEERRVLTDRDWQGLRCSGRCLGAVQIPKTKSNIAIYILYNLTWI